MQIFRLYPSLARACSSCLLLVQSFSSYPHFVSTTIENQLFVKILFFLIQIPLLIQNKILPLPIINERQTKQLLFYG